MSLPAVAALRGLALLLLTGCGLGLLSTVYGALRAVWRLGRVGGAVLDWLWWLMAALAVFVVLLWVDWGAISLWYLVAVAGGYALWVRLAAPLVYPWCERLVRCQARAVGWMLAPFRWVSRGVVRGARGLRRGWPRRPKV